MGYSNNYRAKGMSGLSGTAFDYAGCMRRMGRNEPDKNFVKQWCDNSKTCHDTCQSVQPCPEGYEPYSRSGGNSYGGTSNCDCNCRSSIKAGPSSGGYGNIIPSAATKGRTNTISGVNGVNGLNESFLESLGTIGNLAIVGLAIYGGYALAKKI